MINCENLINLYCKLFNMCKAHKLLPPNLYDKCKKIQNLIDKCSHNSSYFLSFYTGSYP